MNEYNTIHNVLIMDTNPVLVAGISMLLQEDGSVAAKALTVSTGQSMLGDLLAANIDPETDLIIIDPCQFGDQLEAAMDIIGAGLSKKPRYIAYCGVMKAGNQETVRSLLTLGFSGVVSKQVELQVVKIAVASVRHGLVHVEQAFAEAMFQAAPDVDADPILIEKSPMEAELTEREAFVLRAVAFGKSMKEIGHELDLSSKTVETYKARGASKLGLRTRKDIVGHALRSGWVTQQ
ncbi:response regulator transcription factor [Yangia sp. PrR004]|nr:response regulator transcription factor [Salipiger sp. PrR004]